MTTAQGGYFLQPGEGRTITALGFTFTLRAVTADTGGQYLAVEFEIPPGGAVPPHIHRENEEAVYVLEGEVSNRVEERTETQGPGSFCFIKRGTVHGQTNSGSRPVKLLVLLSPSDSAERLFDAINGQPDEQVISLMQQHGMDLVQ